MPPSAINSPETPITTIHLNAFNHFFNLADSEYSPRSPMTNTPPKKSNITSETLSHSEAVDFDRGQEQNVENRFVILYPWEIVARRGRLVETTIERAAECTRERT